jgi:cbb3-type cytochrome oxidase maturation protein
VGRRARPDPRYHPPGVYTLALLILLSLALGLGAWLLFLWSVKSGQYEDPEGPKYRMLEDEEEPEDGRRR